MKTGFLNHRRIVPLALAPLGVFMLVTGCANHDAAQTKVAPKDVFGPAAQTSSSEDAQSARDRYYGSSDESSTAPTNSGSAKSNTG